MGLPSSTTTESEPESTCYRLKDLPYEKRAEKQAREIVIGGVIKFTAMPKARRHAEKIAVGPMRNRKCQTMLYGDDEAIRKRDGR